MSRFMTRKSFIRWTLCKVSNFISKFTSILHWEIDLKKLLFIDCVHSINTFIDRIPDDQKPDYLDDLVERLIKKCSVRDDIDTNSKIPRFILPYKLVVAYARK